MCQKKKKKAVKSSPLNLFVLSEEQVFQGLH